MGLARAKGDKEGYNRQNGSPLQGDNFWAGSGVPKINPGENPWRGENEGGVEN